MQQLAHLSNQNGFITIMSQLGEVTFSIRTDNSHPVWHSVAAIWNECQAFYLAPTAKNKLDS